jgi:NAD-dependent dihydropyrimidine dehydrogenase PreA subunit
MALITIDTEKCVNDGLCRDACPGHWIEIDDEGLPPRYVVFHYQRTN